MVDLGSRTDVERESALADLRAKLADTTEPAVRSALQAAIERLEVASPTIPSGGPGRARIVRALDAQGLTRPEIGEGPHLTENALRVLTHRYFMKNDKFEPVEDAPGMFRRVAPGHRGPRPPLRRIGRGGGRDRGCLLPHDGSPGVPSQLPHDDECRHRRRDPFRLLRPPLGGQHVGHHEDGV